MDVDGGDGNLKAGPQTQQEPAHIELPGLTGCHHHRPPDEEAHHREGQQGGLPSHSVHEKDCTQWTKHGTQGQQAAHPRRLRVGDGEGGVGVKHWGDGWGCVGHADAIGEASSRDGQGGEDLISNSRHKSNLVWAAPVDHDGLCDEDPLLLSLSSRPVSGWRNYSTNFFRFGGELCEREKTEYCFFAFPK